MDTKTKKVTVSSREIHSSLNSILEDQANLKGELGTKECQQTET